jgi:hypothetical protein
LISLVLVGDYSRATLAALVKRMQLSVHLEELVYRESELDEVWRLIDMDRLALIRLTGESEQSRSLAQLQDGIHHAHDIIGEQADGVAAARYLSELIMKSGVGPTQGMSSVLK